MPPRKPSTIRLMLALAIVFCATPSHALAQGDSSRLQSFRAALAHYDVEGEESLSALHDLDRFVISATRRTEAREAAFLRAVLATDLLLYGTFVGDPRVAEHVAHALDRDPERLPELLLSDLGRLARGPYARTVRDAQNALHGLFGGQARRRGAGLRSRMVVLHRLAEAARAEDPLTSLASAGRDPCAGGVACSEPFDQFEPEGRKAMAALRRAGRILRQIRAAAEGGDPLSRVLAGWAQSMESLFSSLVLRPTYRPVGALGMAGGSGNQDSGRVDILLIVDPAGFRLGWTPRVRLGPEGDLQAFAPDGPSLGSIVEWPGFRSRLHGIAQISSALTTMREGEPSATVGVGAVPSVTADLLTRALLSVVDAGMEEPWLVGRNASGALRLVSVRLVRQLNAGADGVRIRVRLGGYTLYLGGEAHDIPRIRAEEGARLVFDPQSLEHQIGERAHDFASVSYMNTAAAGPVVSAIFAAAPRDGTVELVLP